MHRGKVVATVLVFLWLVGPAAAKTVTIGYQATYTPWIAAMADKAFANVTGYRINWRRMKTGADTVNALEKDEIDIGMAGSAPIAAALTLGHDVELFWILQDINFAEALIVRDGSGIVEPQDLRGRRLAVPFASTAHYHLLFALRQFGIEPDEVQLTFASPAEIGTRWQSARVDAAFIWNPVLDDLLRSGKMLLNSGRLSRWGRPTFDGLIADRRWAAAHEDFMAEFVKTLAMTDLTYREQPRKWSSKSQNAKKISSLVGGTPFSAAKSLRLYKFLTMEEQQSVDWLGGSKHLGAAKALKDTAGFLHEQGVIKEILADYSGGVTDRWVKAAAVRMP